MSRINLLLSRHNLPATDGYALICVAEDYARLMRTSVSNVLDGAIFSQSAAERLIRVMRNRQNEA